MCLSTCYLRKHFLFWFFVMLLIITHEAIIHLKSFSLLFLMLFHSYFLLQILICLDVHLLVPFLLLHNLLFFIRLLRFLEKILATFFFYFFLKSLKQTDLGQKLCLYHYHYHLTFLIVQWIFGSGSNSFCLLKSIAISL